MLFAFVVGSTVAGGTYLYAKKKQASTGQSVAAAAASGTASGAATALAVAMISALWLPLLIGSVIGGAYYMGKKKTLKALPPSSGD